MSLSPGVDIVVDNFHADNLWESFINQIKPKVSPVNFNNWFRPITNGRLEEDSFIISVPNKFIADWITDYYLDFIEKGISQLANKDLKLRFSILEEKAALQTQPSTKQMAPTDVSAQPVMQATRIQTSSFLNPKYNFDSFVVGSGNQLAHAAAKSVAELPGGHYNPLYLYGGVGLGKTHLLHAVALELSRKFADFKIIYVSSEKFMNEFIYSVRHERMRDFRKKYRESCDMLLIDDIQFLGGKESTQDEFFHTFNALHDSQRQIIVTSDKIPKDIPGLEERLRSRFEWGLMADIQAPDLETRISILRKKSETDKIPLQNDVAMYLASQIRSNVRELEGALIRLNAWASLKNTPLTLDLAKEVLKNILPAKTPTGTVESIQHAVAEYYQVKIADLKSHRRMRGFSHPRQVAMYLCKKHLKVSFPEIGNKFGGKDHTTVMHACRKIESDLQQDSNLQNDIAVLEQTILG
ncbi:MAG: chromosomal replication initiator protein DnaA [Deltaproteobacteria bacterium]|nr:chromosomal replication initiator protein DnaA [Deltaproteobacteria bacterium]